MILLQWRQLFLSTHLHRLQTLSQALRTSVLETIVKTKKIKNNNNLYCTRKNNAMIKKKLFQKKFTLQWPHQGA
jgi:hypothetical protein